MKTVDFLGELVGVLGHASKQIPYNKCLRDHANDFSPTSSCWYLKPSDSYHSPLDW